MTIDTDQFRTAMRHLAGHVCLITTASKEGGRNGLTATAVCSVSADPPTLLCCVNRQIASYQAIKDNGVFAVNVLALDDRYLADRFASRIRGDDRFREGVWKCLETGAPVLETALASFDCRLSNLFAVHSHGIMFGEIQAVQIWTKGMKRPLLYAHGSYGGFKVLGGVPAEQFWIPSWDWEQYEHGA